VHFAKGTLLDYDDVYLSEGGWPQMAHQDAAERERLRGRHRPLNYASAKAPRVSYGAYEQKLEKRVTPDTPPSAQPIEEDQWSPNVSAEPIPTSLSAEESGGAMQALSISLGGETSSVTQSVYEGKAPLETLPQSSTKDR
jgi:hypothetical protein